MQNTSVHHTHTVPFMPYSVHIILAAVDIEGDLCWVDLFCFSAFMPLLAIKQALQEPHLVFVWVSHIWRASTAKHIFALNLIKPQLVFTPSTCQVGWQYHIILTQKNAELNRSAPSTLLRVLIWLQMDILTVTTGLCVVGWETSVQQSSTKPHCSPVGYTVKLMSLGK